MTALLVATLMALVAWASCAGAGEGKWTPQQVLELGPEWVQEQGFQLPLEQLWDAERGGGLLANAIDIPGCSASFVSPEGLLITNHHCIVDVLQEHSTPEADLLRDGYLARTRADELKATAYPIRVPAAFRDVTEEVWAAVPADAGDLERFRAVEAKGKALVAACEERPSTHCTFATFDGGLFFTLTEFRELEDARLVYAPPEAVGNYGGEIDNWMWPRHSGDFALLRVYDDSGQPYRPEYWFPVSPDGVREGDTVAVLGYPGTTYRSLDRGGDGGAGRAVLPDAPRPLRRVDPHPGGGRRDARSRCGSRWPTTCAPSRTAGRTPPGRSRGCVAAASSRSSRRPTSG